MLGEEGLDRVAHPADGQVRRLPLRLALGAGRVGGGRHEEQTQRRRLHSLDGVSLGKTFHTLFFIGGKKVQASHKTINIGGVKLSLA
ncbi:UNVERIFIED_CONTAM: hypothetical protein PYX00_001823 [Menopon gallinae]|uniref:Uncharacterized protein n=1 Tax=Menopon gallinae TaxID=328185 RepID=A0AAW2IG17_9NEOP